MARAKKTTVNGIVFDSKTEADYYSDLIVRQDLGYITDLDVQPEFEIMKPFQLRKRKIRGMKYTPDFYYKEGDQEHIVEVKGFARADYLMRRKLFLYMYGDNYIFHEVKRKGKVFTDSVW